MNLKDSATGMPRDGGKMDKNDAPKDIEEAESCLERFFRNMFGHDHDALDYVIFELKKMLKYFQNVNEHLIRGMSLFIVIDST